MEAYFQYFCCRWERSNEVRTLIHTTLLIVLLSFAAKAVFFRPAGWVKMGGIRCSIVVGGYHATTGTCGQVKCFLLASVGVRLC